MKTVQFNRRLAGMASVLLLIVSLLAFAGCSSTPVSSDAAIQARNNLTALQKDPTLGKRAQHEMAEAEKAVQLAEEPLPKSKSKLSEHRAYLANQKIEIARAKALTSHAEDERKLLAQERDDKRLQNRTAEANRAQRSEADLQKQLTALQAKPTDRGLVLTLGDVLFATGSAKLQPGADANLRRLADFLNQHPERRVKIEGHTDSTGNPASNQELSKNRANSVRGYLTQQGIAASRLSASGLGQDRPLVSNDSALGRQQNRRVEVIIENAPSS
ncbi:OmpA family protein [Marinospirillum sp.]|uniref:OmpA family protein n=1 Tax=Marinospirillum sp. TaxID=2183934 RepID=UPI00286FFDE3|nr:OmpA family protein [Marinospirillum sp.]MDR9468129.1 OmpA family protein [Marinospirillum sp.]